MIPAADVLTRTPLRILLLEAGLLLSIVSGGAALTYWLSGFTAMLAVLVAGLLCVPIFLLGDGYARRRRRERERRDAEAFERRIRELGDAREIRIK